MLVIEKELNNWELFAPKMSMLLSTAITSALDLIAASYYRF